MPAHTLPRSGSTLRAQHPAQVARSRACSQPEHACAQAPRTLHTRARRHGLPLRRALHAACSASSGRCRARFSGARASSHPMRSSRLSAAAASAAQSLQTSMQHQCDSRACAPFSVTAVLLLRRTVLAAASQLTCAGHRHATSRYTHLLWYALPAQAKQRARHCLLPQQPAPECASCCSLRKQA